MRKSITLNYSIINRIQSKIDTRKNIEQFIIHFLFNRKVLLFLLNKKGSHGKPRHA